MSNYYVVMIEVAGPEPALSKHIQWCSELAELGEIAFTAVHDGQASPLGSVQLRALFKADSSMDALFMGVGLMEPSRLSDHGMDLHSISISVEEEAA